MRASLTAVTICCCIASSLAAQVVESIPENSIALAVNAGGPALPDQGFVADAYAIPNVPDEAALDCDAWDALAPVPRSSAQ